MSCNYIIHACESRMWYVRDYLIPSMKAQGITDITVRCDYQHIGCLDYCMEIFMRMPMDGGAWHLQDDVVISHDFAERTEELATAMGDQHEIVCGFAYTKDENCSNTGLVNVSQMWWSFPCIYIPNRYARECAKWYHRTAKTAQKYRKWVQQRKFDDAIFREYMVLHYPEKIVNNIVPNLVDHVDYLIGGSVINGQREAKQTRSHYFEDEYPVKQLENELLNRREE